jgi:flagellum-specific ATP synthase
VREFVDMSLGAEGLKKAVLVIAPADESPLMRVMATELCHSIAAHYRDQGKHVLLLVDSLTRYAMACAKWRWPWASRRPPRLSAVGVSNLPQLVEAPATAKPDGSMSAIYTVLAEGDDQQDPVVDTARAILDGHIVLTRELAERGHYPAIDIAASISRCMAQVITPEHMQAARALKASMARHARVRDLIRWAPTCPAPTRSPTAPCSCMGRSKAFLCQGTKEEAPMGPCIEQLEHIMA